MACGEIVRMNGGDWFIWNLSGPVGLNCSNRVDDVELVRFGYKCWSKVTFGTKGNPPELQLFIEQMNYLGGYSDDLQYVIDKHQSVRGGAIDRKISVAHPTQTNGAQYDLHHIWIMWGLSNAICKTAKDIWPRIDREIFIGPSIKETARKLFEFRW